MPIAAARPPTSAARTSAGTLRISSNDVNRFPNDDGQEPARRRRGERSRSSRALRGSATRELLRALEEAYPGPVRRRRAESSIDAADAVIVFPGERRPDRLRSPVPRAAGAGRRARSGDRRSRSRCPGAAGLDRALHGQRLVEHGRQAAGSRGDRHGLARARASAAGKPIWAQSDRPTVRTARPRARSRRARRITSSCATT